MTLQNRIRALMAEKGINQNQLAKAVGCTRATVSDWYNGNTAHISPDYVFAVASYFNVTERWLNTGGGNRSIPQQPLVRLGDSRKTAGYRPVELLTDNELVNYDIPMTGNLCPIDFSDEVLTQGGRKHENIKVLESDGSIASERLAPGDYVLIDTGQRSPMKHGRVYAIYVSGTPKLYLASIMTTGMITLTPNNGGPAEQVSPAIEESLQIIGEAFYRAGPIM